LKLMDIIPTVIPGLTRDPETAADWIPAFAGIACPGLDPGTGRSIGFCMTGYQGLQVFRS
jgi:hypothetical protein